jgi:hypothetical protein
MEQAFYFADDNEIKVSTFATFYPEDEEIIPKWMIKTDTLEMSVLDLQDFGIPRKLPLFREILQKLYDTSNADYFIHTNVDICLMPHFYLFVKDMIEKGHDSFAINKRIIPEELKDESLSMMYSNLGIPHAGIDCFVFRRELFPLFSLGNNCVGVPWGECNIIANMIAYSKNFTLFTEQHVTFGIGDRRDWLPPKFNDYRVFCTNEFARILKKLFKRNKKILKHPVILYLLTKLKSEVIGYKDETYSKDCWYFVNKK